jgi:hypothetical protein
MSGGRVGFFEKNSEGGLINGNDTVGSCDGSGMGDAAGSGDSGAVVGTG